jgi:hypothetical protein
MLFVLANSTSTSRSGKNVSKERFYLIDTGEIAKPVHFKQEQDTA